MRKKLIIDGNNLLHRAHWAYKKNENDYNSDNRYVIYVFLNILKSYIRLFEPSEIIVCWDYRLDNEINERKETLEEYKAQRSNNKEVFENMPAITDILSSLGVKQMRPKNFEADDIMYWLCAEKYPNQCILVTTDSDMYQLIVPDLCENIFYNPKRKMQINEVFLKQKYSVNDGYEFIIKKALRGDSADNITGVKGIRQTRIDSIIECLGKDFDIDALKKSDILKPEEFEIFERNIKLMKLDEVMNHPNEIEWYENSISDSIEPDKEKFKDIIKKAELWIIYRKINEWFYAFQQKPEPKSKYVSTYINEYFTPF